LLTFSGGVAEYVFGYEQKEHGDIAKFLAAEIGSQLGKRSKITVVDPGQRIRATVIGASQFTVQVSGKTIYLPDENPLPVHNVPVVHVDMDLSGKIDSGAFASAIENKIKHADLDPHSRMAIAFTWAGDPEYSRIRAAAEGIMAAVGAGRKEGDILFLTIEGDVGRTFGHLLESELKFPGHVISIDGVRGAFEAMVAGKLNVTVECSPLLGPVLMQAVKDLKAGKALPRRLVTEEGVFPAEVAAKELPRRKY